jgi:hypothetical protein
MVRIIRISTFTVLASLSFYIQGIPRLNLFQPYDILIVPERIGNTHFTFQVGYEASLHTHGFRADDDEKLDRWRKRVNPLQLWQDTQNGTTALRGIGDHKLIDELLPFLYDHYDHAMPRCFIPSGRLDVHANLMLSAQFYLPHNLIFGLYLPWYSVERKNVHWRDARTHELFEELPLDECLSKLEKIGHINLRQGWKRSGIGDLATLVWWFKNYPQLKRHLRDVRLGARGGLLFPTGKKGDEERLLGLPFGHDGSLGILFGGTLELGLNHYIILGADIEFIHLFGNTRLRRVRVDPAQTDLLLMTRLPAFRDPGFIQHYTLFIQALRFYRGLSLTLAYQYTKQNNDKLFLSSDRFDSRFADCSESLDDWTVHNLVFKLNYDFFGLYHDHPIQPSIAAFYKLGLNGKRSIVADTLGATVSISF